MWYSRLFTSGNSYCYHELTSLYQPYPTNLARYEWLETEVRDHGFELAQRRMLLQGFPEYFARLWERVQLGNRVVGNSDWFVSRMAPALWLLWPDMRFLFSFRNGISVVNSWFAWKEHVPASVRSSLRERFGTGDYFDQCCHIWTDEVEVITGHENWLEARGASCLETRLETVTSDRMELRRVWEWVIGDWERHAAAAEAWMSEPVNARINVDGVISWQRTWETWPNAHRQAFAAICGEAQHALGYKLPER
jgi:hypothetical protein